jgi:hypothetical protein
MPCTRNGSDVNRFYMLFAAIQRGLLEASPMKCGWAFRNRAICKLCPLLIACGMPCLSNSQQLTAYQSVCFTAIRIRVECMENGRWGGTHDRTYCSAVTGGQGFQSIQLCKQLHPLCCKASPSGTLVNHCCCNHLCAVKYFATVIPQPYQDLSSCHVAALKSCPVQRILL